MNFKNFKVGDENDDNAVTKRKFSFKLTFKVPEQKFEGTTQTLGNFISKKLQSSDHANNSENDDLFYMPTENVSKISISVSTTSQTTNVNNGKSLELQTLFEPKEAITVTPIAVQSPLNFDDILEISSSIDNDEDFTKSISVQTSSAKSTNEHKQQSNNETPTAIPVELLSLVEQTENPSKTVSAISSSNNDNENTEKSDEFGVLETISFDQDWEEPAKITAFHLTSTSSTIPSSNTQIAQKLTLKELQNLDISTTNNENDEITNQVSALKTNSYDAEHSMGSSLTTFPDIKLLQTDSKKFRVTFRVTNTGIPPGGFNSETNNYGEITNVKTHHPTNDGRVTFISEFPKSETWPQLTSKNLDESMPKLSSVTDELLGLLPSKVLTDENMAISNTGLESTATPMEGNKQSGKLQNILITTNKLSEEIQVKDNINGEELTSAALAKDHENLPTQTISETSFKVTSEVENLPHTLQSTRQFFNYFKVKGTTDENMIPTQPSSAAEEDILSKILETTHYPFLNYKFKIPTDENMVLQELEKTVVNNFAVSTESSTVSALVMLNETDSTVENAEIILMTKNNFQEGTPLNVSSIGNMVSDEPEFTTMQTHIDENKDLLTSNELLTTIGDNFPSNLTIKDVTTITLATPFKEHDNVPTQIIGNTSEVTEDVEKLTQDRFNNFMIKKITNEDMVSSKFVLVTEVETTPNPFIENKLKITTDENMHLQEQNKSIVSTFEFNSESSTVSALVQLDETATTEEKNNLQKGTQFNASSIGNVVSEELEFTTLQTHIDGNKDLLTSSELLTTIGNTFPSNLTIKDVTTITLATLFNENDNVLTQIIGSTSEVTEDVEKPTQDRFNNFMIKKITNEDMVSSKFVLVTEVETTPNPFIENKLKITTDENMYLQEQNKSIVSIFEINRESSTVSALVQLNETATTEEKNNLQKGTQFNASSIGNVISEEPEFTTFQTHFDENKDLLTSNELLTSFEVISIGDNFPSNVTIKDGTTINLAILSKEHNIVLTRIMGKTSAVTGEVEKTTRDKFNKFMLKKTTNEDMVSSEPVLTTEVESLSHVLKTTPNPLINHKLKITTTENMHLQELEKTVVSISELNTESLTVSALAKLEEIDTTTEKSNLQEGIQLNASSTGNMVSEEPEFTTLQTHIDENKNLLTSNELLTSSEVTSIGDNFPSNLTIKDGTIITLATLSKQHKIMDKTSKVTGEVPKTTRDRFNEFMLKKTTNEDMVSSEPVLSTEVESSSQVLKATFNPFIHNKFKVTNDENMILQEPEKTFVTNFPEINESSTTSAHVLHITTLTETLPNVITVTVKLPEQNHIQESTNKNAETEFATVITKIENKVLPDLTTTVKIAPHILTKTTVDSFSEFQFKDTTANEDMASIEHHSATTLTNLPQILKTTEDLFGINQLSETTNEDMLSKETELTTTVEETTSNLLLTAQKFLSSETKETTNSYVEENKEPSAKLNKFKTLIEEITKSENFEHIVTDETHLKENTDLLSKDLKLTEVVEENMNGVAKLKGEFTNTMEVSPHISKTTNSLLKNFLVERTTDEDMIPQEPEKTSFKENEELSTESEHSLQTTAVESLPNIATTKQSEENKFQEATNKFAENQVLPDFTTTVTIASHILTETTKNLFQEFQLVETTVNEDMSPIESHSTTTVTNLPHISETTSQLFEEITNEDMLSKEAELTTLTTTMEENNELLTSNVPVTAEKVNTNEAKETPTILNELSTLSKKPTQLENLENIPATTELTHESHFKESTTTYLVSEEPRTTEIASHTEKNINIKGESTITKQASEHYSATTYNIFKIFEPIGSTNEDMPIIGTKPPQLENLENIPATTELTHDSHFKESTTTYLVSEVPRTTEIASHTEKNININGESTITKQASEHHSETTYNIFKIFEPIGSTNEDMPIIEHTVLPQITKIIPNVFIENELKQTTNNEAISSVKFEVITSTVSAVENKSSNNIKVKTETLQMLSSNTPTAPNIVTESHAIIVQNEFKSKAPEEISDLTTSNKIILNTHTVGIGTSVESFSHSPTTTIHTEIVSSKSTDSSKALQLNTDNLSKTTHDINFSSTYSDKNLLLSNDTNAYTETTKEFSNLNKEQSSLSSYETNSASSVFSSSNPVPEHNQSFIHFQEVTTKSYGNENGDWVKWPEMNSTSEKNTVSTLITKLTISDLLTTESSATNDVTEIFQDAIGLSTKSKESSSETSPTLPNELQLDFNQTPIEHFTNLSTVENSLESTIITEGYHFKDITNNIFTNYMSTVEAGKTLYSVQTNDQYTSSSQNTMELKTAYNQMKETQLGGITSPNIHFSSTISVKTHEPNATHFPDFEELTTKSYGNENGDWVTWPEINSTSETNTVSTLLTKFTISDSVSTANSEFNDITEIFQDPIGLSTRTKETLSESSPTLPDELQLGSNQAPIQDSTNLSQITAAKNNFESAATTLNVNSFSTTERYHLKDITNNILTNYLSPIGIENTLHAFNTNDQLDKSKFENTIATDIMNVKSSGQMTTQFEYNAPESKSKDHGMNTKLNIGTRLEVTSSSKHTLAIPDKIEPTVTTINPLFTLTEDNVEITKPFAITHKTTLLTLPEGSDQAKGKNTEAHDTNKMHNPSEITDTYTSTLLKSSHVDHLSHGENLGTESGNTLTLMISEEITQLNQASIGSTLTNQNYQTEQHDTNLMNNLDETSETHTSTFVKSTEKSEILSHNQTLQSESGNKLTSDLNLTSFATEVFLATTLSTPNSDSKVTENNFNTVSHEKVLEHTENTNNPTAEVIPHLELLDEEFMHFSTLGTHITTTNIHDRTTPIIHTTTLGDEFLISLTEPKFLNSENILAKQQSEIIQNSQTTLGVDQGMIGNQIIHSMNTDVQPLTTVNAHSQLSANGQTIISAEHGITTNELTHSVNTDNQALITENAHSESSHNTLELEHGIPINELTHSISTEIQPLITENPNSEFSESSHTTLSVEQGISPIERTHLLTTANQPLTTENIYHEFSESGHTTASVEQGILPNELTHSVNTEHQPLTNVNAHPHLVESGPTTLSPEHGISSNELAHSVNTDYNQPLTTMNAYPYLSESNHPTLTTEHGISPNELTHSVNTENQPLTTVNEHPHLSETGYITLSVEHGISSNELTNLVNTENQPLTTVNEHLHLSETGHITLSVEHGILPNELTHSVNTENQPLTTVNELPHLSETGHNTLSGEHGIPPTELTNLVNTENQPLTTVSEHLEFSQSSHTTLSLEHGISINELTHLANTENIPLKTVNTHPYLSESGPTALSPEHGTLPNELTHSLKLENQPLTIANEHPHLSENHHTTFNTEHGVSPNELTHSVNTENQPLTTVNEHIEFSENSHTTLSSGHGLSINGLTHLSNTENQPLTIVNLYQNLSESGHTTLSAEHGISLNELTHSVSIEHQPLTTINTHPEFLESSHTTLSSEHEISINEFTHSANTENQPQKTVNAHPHLSESGSTALSPEHGTLPNELTHSVNTESQPLTTVNKHIIEFSESSHTTLSSEHGISIIGIPHLASTENQPLTAVSAYPHLSESAHTTFSAEHGISPNELTHSVNTENQLLTTISIHPEFSESSHITLSSEHGISINKFTHSANTENQPLTNVNAHPHLSEISSTTLGPEHELSTNELSHSINISHLPNTENQSLPNINPDLQISDNSLISSTPIITPSSFLTDYSQKMHATLPEEMEISDNETSGLPTLTDHDVLKSTKLYETIHATFPSELSDNETLHLPTFTDQDVLKSTEFTIFHDITKHSNTNQIDHTTAVPKLEVLDEELIQFPSKTFIENTTHHTILTALPEISQNIYNNSNSDLGITSSEISHLLNTATQLLLTETTEHQIGENLHTGFGSTFINIHGSVSNNINENIHITSHADLGISSNELPHLVNTGTTLLPTETTEHHIADNLHTSLDTVSNIHGSASSDIDQNIHSTSPADLSISNNESSHLQNTATQLLSTETTEHQIAKNLHTSFGSTSAIIHDLASNDISQNIHTTSHADMGISNNESPPLLNTATQLLSTETTEHQIAENLHTSFSSTSAIIHDLALNDISQNIHTTSHEDLGISNNESPPLLNTATQLLSTESTEHQIAENLHTSFGSTSAIIHDLASNDISQNIHTTSHADMGISNNESPPLLNTATQLLSTETTEHQIAENLHTSFGSTSAIIHDLALNDISQNIHTTFHEDLGISNNESPPLLNTATQLLSTESTEHQIAENLHTSFGSTFAIIHDLASNDISQNIHTTSHADMGISNNESPPLLNTATQLLSTEISEHQISDNLYAGFSSTSVITNTDIGVLNSTEFTVFEDITKHFEINQVDHTTDTPKLEILDEELIHLPSKPLTKNTTYHTEPTILSDNNQNINTKFHADLGIASGELPHLINTATPSISSETTVHQVEDNLHTSFDSNDISQSIHTNFHADLGISSSELPHLVNTETTLLSTETSEQHISDNLHTSLVSTSNIHDLTSNNIDQSIHTTSHVDLGISSSELSHLSIIATQLLPHENTDNQISNIMHTSSITPTTFIFSSTESGSVLTNTDQTVLNSTIFTVLENIAKHSETNQIDLTTDIPKLEILDEELIHLPSKLSTDHLATSGNELSQRPNTLTKPLTNLNMVSPTLDNIPIGITIPSTLIVQNTDSEAKSNTENKFTHLTENLANHSEVAHNNHNTLISTLGITSHDLLNTENQQISDIHSSLVNPGTSIIPGSGNESKLLNSTEFSVYEDLAKHLETTQINHTTVVPKLEILDEEFVQIRNKTIPLTENTNQITNHTDLTTLTVTSSEFLPLPTITLFEQIFSDFTNNNTLNYTKSEMEELTTEPLKSTLVEISNQNLNGSSEISNEHFLGTESSYIDAILTTNTNLVTNAFSHNETDNEFLKTHSTFSELQTLDFAHSTESFKENLISFHEWLGQPTVNGTDQTTMFSNVNESTLTVKTNSDIEILSTNDLKHFSTLTHSTVSYLPNITNESSLHSSQQYLGTETNQPSIFTINGAEEHQSNSNPENVYPNQQGMEQNQTLPPVITTSTFPYSQNYHNENFTASEKLPHVSVSQEMMSFEITTLLPTVATTSTLAYNHNYHTENFSANQEFSHTSVSQEIISSGVTTFPISITSTETFVAKSETSSNFSTTQSLAFHNKSSSTEVQNLENFLKTDQVGNSKNESGASSTKVSDTPTTHESTENLSETQNKTSGDTFNSKNKNIDSSSSETSNLTTNNLKTTGKEFEKNSNEGMWQWPSMNHGMEPESPISSINPLTGEHAKITQPDVTIANAKFEPADNEILFTSKPNLSTTALEHSVSSPPNLVTHVTHPKLQPEVHKNIPSLEIQTEQHNPPVGNISLHQSHGKLENAPIYIHLPVYPVDSTYPLLIKFNEYYSSTTKSSVIIDDEATDKVINTEQFRTMKFEDFNAVTEFPSTTIKMEEPAISKLSHSDQILGHSLQPTTALDKALKTDNIESNQQTTKSEVTHVGKTQDKLPDVPNENVHQDQQNAELTTKSEVIHIGKTQDKVPDVLNENVHQDQQNAELTTKSEVTHVGKTQDKLPDVLNENVHQDQQNAELTTKSETVHMSSTEEKMNQITEPLTVGSSLGATHIESTTCTSSNTLNKEIGLEEINKTTESSMMNAHSQPVMIISEFPKFQEESTCNYTDYLSQNNCMCSMDNLIKDLRMKLVNNFLNFSIDNFTCPIFTHVEAGIFLGNDSVPQVSKSRREVLSDMYSIVVRRETIDYQNMDRTLNEQLELKNTENDIFATPGMKILIPCISSNNLSEGSSNYSWTFSDNLPLTEGKIQEIEGTLTIDNVAPQDAGNYTCIATSSITNKSNEKRYEHHLSVVSIPSYRLQTTLLYNSTEKCQSGDADIISLYLPHSLEGLICGNYFKVCSIEVKDPKCLNATQYTSVNLTVVIEPINVIMPAINNSVCDVGCEMKIYTHVVLFIIKNLEAVLKLPVFFRLSYRQQKLMPTEVVIKKTRQKLGTEAPKLIITCPPGFGYYKKTHVCGTCGRNTFSRGDETFCSPCPSGQYQPMVGSKSCLICATPLQDPYCLRVMYSNTHKFRVLIGITATVLVVLIILLLCIKSMKKGSNSRNNTKFGREAYLKNKRQSKRRSRDPDVEMQDSEPLLECNIRERKYSRGYNRKPPEPPPPDFY